MGKIWITSDTHLGHDREFIWGPRGFSSCAEHDAAIVEKWNSLVSDEDDVYLLGDVILGDSAHGIELLKQLKGKIHIARGNHDTDKRIQMYKECDNVVEVCDVYRLKYNKWEFYLSHFPTLVSNFEEFRKFYCLHGHTHSTNKFEFISSSAYNISCDAHNCFPIDLDYIINDIKSFGQKCS